MGVQGICLQCAEVSENESECPNCGSHVSNNTEFLEYARDVVRYGYLYRTTYEARENLDEGGKYHLADLPEIYSWLALAALGGVVGNLTTDSVKAIFRRIIDNSKKHPNVGPSYEQLVNITDHDLEKFFEYVREYHNGMDNIADGLRNLIVEEMIAYAVSEDEYISKKLACLIFREQIKPKHKKKAVTLYRAALHKKMAKSGSANKESLNGLWGKV